MVGRGVVVAAVLMLLGCTRPDSQVVKPQPLTQKEQKLAEVFQQHGSPHPVELARVVVKMKRPRLAAAQAIIESDGTVTARGTAGEIGIWQVIERDWGPTPKNDIQGQADQYESIMESLIKESDGNLRRALGKYNGDRTGKYARKVLAKVEQIKL